jgi:hypothetical protein
MTTARYRFINFLLKECSGLNYVLLKYIHDDIVEFASNEKLEILIDKEDYKTLLYVISSAREISRIQSRKNVSTQIINIKFSDHSSLDIKIKIDIERRGIILMNSRAILRSSSINKQNIKVPAPCFQFEYILLSAILNKTDVEDRFRNYFSNFSFETRSKIFAHIRPKYNFILNILDELYTFSDGNYHKIVNTIKAQKQNKGWRYTFHKIVFAYNYLGSTFVNGWQQFSERGSHSSNGRTASPELKDLLQRNALVRN